jgi:hypothetical protein
MRVQILEDRGQFVGALVDDWQNAHDACVLAVSCELARG